MENEARACGLFSVHAAGNFAQFPVFYGCTTRRHRIFPVAETPPRHAFRSPDFRRWGIGHAFAFFHGVLQPFVFKASSGTKKKFRIPPARCLRPLLPARRRAAVPGRIFFHKSVDILKTLDLAFPCVPRESSRVIKTSSTIQANAIDCLPAIEKSSSPAKTVPEAKRLARTYDGTRPRKASGVFFSAGLSAVLPGAFPGHCSTWAL